MKNTTRLLGLAALIAAPFVAQCTNSATAPKGAAATVSAVVLTAASVTMGSTGQGSVSLAGAASAGGASITLTSSTPAVATVQTLVMIPEGSTSAAFTFAAIAAGTTTITATFNGGTPRSAQLTVTAGAVLASMSLSASTVVGGDAVTGTVTLTGVAPAGGATVSLSGGDPVTVAGSVIVPAGSTSAMFQLTTRAVGGTIPVMITASYGGVSASAPLSVTRPTAATARFGVRGPNETDTCAISNGGATLNCTFDGSTSAAPGNIVAWDWTWRVATTFNQTTAGPQLTMANITCSLLPPAPLPPGNPWFAMVVTLKVHDDQGNVSAEATDVGVRILPQGVCGF